MVSEVSTAPTLQRLDPRQGHSFAAPAKRIHNEDDVTYFLASRAYADIMTFIFRLNTAMLPRNINKGEQVRAWKLNDPDMPYPPIALNLAKLLQSLTAIIDEAPPDPGPRRFGNMSFRTWYAILTERISGLLEQYLPYNVLAFPSTSDVSVTAELEAYLIGSFGSSQRLDYGTGHELSFLAFLGCLWKLGAFPESEDGDQERGIVLGVIEPYLALIRRLILTYTLEPAGSHGVWGLDDHSFLPYIFGSAQMSPSITNPADVVTEGSLADSPNPADVANSSVVERERRINMYFSAIGFIHDVKKGAFWEHSPILYDISGVKAGWAKINKGMIKMYNAEVLSKFPVIQHFPFGSLFAWEIDPNAKYIQASAHTSNRPKTSSTATTTHWSQPPLRDPLAEASLISPHTRNSTPVTTASWITASTDTKAPNDLSRTIRAPSPVTAAAPPALGARGTTAPWTKRRSTAGIGNASEALGTPEDMPLSAWAPHKNS